MKSRWRNFKKKIICALVARKEWAAVVLSPCPPVFQRQEIPSGVLQGKIPFGIIIITNVRYVVVCSWAESKIIGKRVSGQEQDGCPERRERMGDVRNTINTALNALQLASLTNKDKDVEAYIMRAMDALQRLRYQVVVSDAGLEAVYDSHELNESNSAV
jgi:hypothetical protein